MISLIWHEAYFGAVVGWWHFVQAHWLAILIVVVSTCLVGLVVLLGRYVKIGFNVMRDTMIPLSMVSNASDKLPGTELEFFALDGMSLRGVLLRGKASQSGQATIIFCHEFGANKNSCLRYCSSLLEAGFNIFTFDFRNHGNSSRELNYAPRQWPTDKEVADVLGACAFVSSLYSDGHPIGLFGISRGGGAAIMAAAQTDVVRAIIADGVFSTDWVVETSVERWAEIFARLHMVYRYLPQFGRFFRWMVVCVAELKLKCRFPSVRKAVNRMSARPVFFIHGRKDSYVRPEQATRIYEQAQEPKFLWIVPKAKHNLAVEVAPELYSRRTAAFFSQYLLNAESSQEKPSFEDIAELKPIGAA